MDGVGEAMDVQPSQKAESYPDDDQDRTHHGERGSRQAGFRRLRKAVDRREASSLLSMLRHCEDFKEPAEVHYPVLIPSEGELFVARIFSFAQHEAERHQ